MATSLGDLIIPIKAVTDAFRRDVDKAATDAGASAGSKFGASFEPKLAKIGWTSFAAGAAIATKGMVELDTATQRYRATTGATQADVDKMQKTTLDLFRHNLQSIGEITDVLATLRTDLGLTQDQADKAAQSFLNYAKVTGQDNVGAVKAFDDILDSWGLTAADATGIMDQLVKSHQLYGGSIEGNQEALARLAPTMKGLGVDVGGTIGLLNLFASSGLDASQATAALTHAVAALKPGQSLPDLIASIQAIQDPTERAQKAIEIFGARGGVALANLQGNFKDFQISASDAAGTVDTASQQMNDSLVTKVQLAIKDIGGQVIATAAAFGPAANGIIGSIGLIGAAFEAMKISAIAGWLATLGPVALATGGAGLAFVGAIDALSHMETGAQAAAEAADNLTGAQARLKAQVDSGAITLDEYDAQLKNVQDQQYRQAEAAARAAGADNAAAASAGKAAVAADRGTQAAKSNAAATAGAAKATDGFTRSLDGSHDAAISAGQGAGYASKTLAQLAAEYAKASAQAATSAEYTQHYGDVTDGASASTAAFRDELASAYGITISDAQAALFLARGMNAAAVAAQNAAAGIAAFRAGHPTNAHYGAGTADAQVQFNPGSINTETSDFDPEALIQHNIGLGPNFGYVAPTKTPRGRGGSGGAAGGKSQATKDAEAQAKALHDKVVAAFEEAKTAGDAYYDSVHTQNQKAISDAHDLARNKIAADHEAAAKAIEEAHREANERISAGRAAVNAQLAEQRRLNAAPVTEAERAQQAIEDQRRLRDLQEQLAAAQASGDVKAQRSAQEALQSFSAQQNIAALREQQALSDAASQARADAQNAALDEQQRQEDERYQHQKDDEDARFAARNAAEDTRYATQQHDLDVRDARQKKEFDDHIAALEDSKKATLALAQATEKKYLQDQLALAQKYGTAQDVKFAQQDLATFLKGLPKHGSGGYVAGPQLAFIGESGPEWVIPDRPDSPAAIAARAQFGAGSTTRTSNRSQTVNIYNPAPEPAGMDTHRYLQALAAFGS